MSEDSSDKYYYCGQLSEHRCRSITHIGTWRKPFYKRHLKHKDYIKSPILYAGLYKELEWQFYLYPKGDEYVQKREYVSIYPFIIKNDFLTPVRASYEISFLSYDKDILHTQSFTVYMKEKELKELPRCSKFLSLAEIYRLSTDDYKGVYYCVTINYEENFNHGYAIRQLFRGFEPILRDQKYCDVTLVSADGIEIPAHKIILAGKSPVFSAMFEHDLKEQKSNIVKVDFEFDILDDFLQCLYTCSSKFLQKKPCDWMAVCKLLCAADKYQVLYLKELCVKHLEESLCVENVCEIFKLADFQNLARLKNIALDFINENSIDMNEDGSTSLDGLDVSKVNETDILQTSRAKVDETEINF